MALVALQLVYPDIGDVFTDGQYKETSVEVYAGVLAYRVFDDAPGAGAWTDGTAQTFKLSLRYKDVGTEALQLHYSTDGITETVLTVLAAKTNSGQFKWLHFATPLVAVFGHDVFADLETADFYIACDGDLIVSSLKLKESVTKSLLTWLPTPTNENAVDGEAVLDETIAAIKFTASIQSDNYVAGVSGWKIFRSTGSAEFNDITARGTLYATLGLIGGWTIGATTLSSDAGNVSLDSAAPKITLGAASDYLTGKGVFMGKSAGVYKWRVGDPAAGYIGFDNTDLLLKNAGLEVWNGATQTGNIQKNGNGWFGSSAANKTIQWTATGTDAGDVRLGGSGTYWLWDDSVGKVLLNGSAHEMSTGAVMTVYGTIKSDNFVSGDTGTGWKISFGGDAVFRNVRVRGEIATAVFVKDLISARAGSEITANSAGTLYATMTVPAAGTWTMHLVDPPGTGWLLATGDICYVKETQGSVSATYFTVTRTTQAGGVQNYTCTWQNGTRPASYEKGLAVVGYGVSGQGWILQTADDAVSPRISIYTHAGAPWSAVTERARLGNLSGITDATFGVLTGYGLWTDNVYLTGGINATSGTISGVLTIGASGGFYQGTGSFASPTTGLKIYNSGGVGLIEMWGSSIKQVYFDSTGALNAGAGAVKWDANGISIAASAASPRFRFTTGATVMGYINIEDSGAYGYDGDIHITELVAGKSANWDILAQSAAADVTMYFEAAGTSAGNYAAGSTSLAWLNGLNFRGFVVGGGSFTNSDTMLQVNGGMELRSASPVIRISNTGAPATYIYSFSGSVLKLAQAGGSALELMAWDKATGNVGIGAIAPASLLHLKSGAPTFRMEDTTASAKSLLVTTDANITSFGEVTGGNFFYLDLANARVGAGTSSPNAILHTAYSNLTYNAGATAFQGDQTTHQTTTTGFNSIAFQATLALSAAAGITNNFSQSGMYVGANLRSAHAGTLGWIRSHFIDMNVPASAAGTVTQWDGLYIQLRNGGANTASIGTFRGINIAAPTAGAGETVTNVYGILINDITIGATNNYAIFTGRGDIRLMSNTADKFGVWGATPVARGTAFTQTYSTASHTQSNLTASNPPAGGVGATAGAYDTAAHRDAMITSLTNLIADHTNTKQVLNALIDDMQAIGWVP